MGTTGSYAIRRACAQRQRGEAVLQPGLADMLEPAVLEAVHALADDRMKARAHVVGEPVQPARADLAGIGTDREGRDVADMTVALL